MDGALVVLLALLWAVALLPGAVRSRRVNTHATVGGFERAMDVLRRQPDGRYMMVPHDAGRIVGRDHDGTRPSAGEPSRPAHRDRREDPTVARRRTAFLRALAATGALLLVALVAGGFAWTLFTLAFVATAGYAALLRQLKLQRDQVRAKVRHLRAEVEDVREERMPVAVGAAPMFDGRVPVASRPDEPWEPQTAVRIRRWDD